MVRDVRVAYLNAMTANDRMALTEQLLQQAQLALDLAQSRYDLGLELDRRTEPGATQSHLRADRKRARQVRLPEPADPAGVSDRGLR